MCSPSGINKPAKGLEPKHGRHWYYHGLKEREEKREKEE